MKEARGHKCPTSLLLLSHLGFSTCTDKKTFLQSTKHMGFLNLAQWGTFMMTRGTHARCQCLEAMLLVLQPVPNDWQH